MKTKNKKNNLSLKATQLGNGKQGGSMGGSSSLIYGILPVVELLKSERRKVEKILISENIRSDKIAEIIGASKERGIRVEKASRQVFERHLGEGVNHQGVIAFASAGSYYDSEKLFEEIVEKENSLCVVLDGIEDPRNFGAILRSAEGAGVDGIFIPERRAVGLTETVAKSSAGATEYVKVAKVTNVNRLIDNLKARNVWVIGTSGEANMAYADWDWKHSSALVLGSEGKGLHRLTAEKCDALVKIPMNGKIESLNVSVAAGVILFEAVRQRG